MKPNVDVVFWNERARQPECLTVINSHSKAYAITLLSDSDEAGVARYKLIEQYNERMQRAGRI